MPYVPVVIGLMPHYNLDAVKPVGFRLYSLIHIKFISYHRPGEMLILYHCWSSICEPGKAKANTVRTPDCKQRALPCILFAIDNQGRSIVLSLMVMVKRKWSGLEGVWGWWGWGWGWGTGEKDYRYSVPTEADPESVVRARKTQKVVWDTANTNTSDSTFPSSAGDQQNAT